MKRMTELHPDRHTLKSSDEQNFFRMKASEVTRAYTILNNPHERAVHLMKLLGKPMDESSTVRVCIIFRPRGALNGTDFHPELTCQK